MPPASTNTPPTMRRIRLFASLRGWRLSWLAPDLLAGLTLAAITIPEQLATARLAGLPPETGLYVFIAGSLAFAIFGASRFISVGADSTIAPIIAGGLAALAATGTAAYATHAAALALMVGLVLVLAALFRAGWIASLLSIPVTTGFLAGISVRILLAQLPAILGLASTTGLAGLLGQLPQANPWTIAIAAGVLLIAITAERLGPLWPGPLVGLVAAALAVWGFGLRAHGVAVLGGLPPHLPRLSLPLLPVEDLGRLTLLALIIALVCMIQTAAVARAFAGPDAAGASDADVSRDFAAVGAGNLACALIGGFAVDSSPPRSGLVVASGGRSQLAGIVAVALVVGFIFYAGPAFAFVPYAALAGVLAFIALRIFQISRMVDILRHGQPEILLVAASAGLVVALPIQTGVALSIVLSLLHGIYIVARPVCAVLARVPGTTIWWPPAAGDTVEHVPGVLVFAPAAPLDFTNAGYVRGQLRQAIAAQTAPVQLVVIEASGMIAIDYTGARILQQTITELQARGIAVAMARLEAPRAQVAMRESGLLDTLGAGNLFHSVEQAVRALHPE